MASTRGKGTITEELLNNQLNKEFGAGNYLLEDDTDTTKWKVTVNGVTELVKKSASSSSTINFDQIMANAKANRQGYEALAIGTDGELVNLNLWYFERGTEPGTIRLGPPYIGSGGPTKGYLGEFVDGEIIGTVPQYIMPEGEDNFLPVTEMKHVFDYTDLVISPEIPSTVTNLESAFYNANKMTTPPEIPDGITNLHSTFQYCLALQTPPEIPNSVVNMQSTFSNCTNLTTPPVIPNSVTNMQYMFFNCTNLTTPPVIPSGVTNLQYMFYNCSNLTTPPIIPNGVTNLQRTFEQCTNLTTPPVIPSSVTTLYYTFYKCFSLTGDLVINVNSLTSYSYCLYDAAKNDNCNLKISGTASSTILNNILNTKSSNSHISLK